MIPSGQNRQGTELPMLSPPPRLKDDPHGVIDRILRDDHDGVVARPAGNDRTNSVFFLEDAVGNSAVLKKFDPAPREHLFYLIGQWASGRSSLPSLDKRMFEDIRGNVFLDRVGLTPPRTAAVVIPEDLEDRKDWDSLGVPVYTGPEDYGVIWMEQLSGEPAKEWAYGSSPDDVYDICVRWGGALRDIHDMEYRLFDLRWPNLLVDRDPSDLQLGYVDTEFAFPDRGKATREVDLGTLISDAMQLPFGSFREAVAGIEEGYGQTVDGTVIGASRITSWLHALEEGDPGRATRAWNNGGLLLEARFGTADGVMADTRTRIRNRFADARCTPEYEQLPIRYKCVHIAVDRLLRSGRVWVLVNVLNSAAATVLGTSQVDPSNV